MGIHNQIPHVLPAVLYLFCNTIMHLLFLKSETFTLRPASFSRKYSLVVHMVKTQDTISDARSSLRECGTGKISTAQGSSISLRSSAPPATGPVRDLLWTRAALRLCARCSSTSITRDLSTAATELSTGAPAV